VIGGHELGDGDGEEVASLCEIGSLEVEGDGDQGFDALDGGGMRPESGVRVGAGIGYVDDGGG
jgi:hypothetical protein